MSASSRVEHKEFTLKPEPSMVSDILILYFFEKEGWQGILVEPNPTQFKALLQFRGQKNLCLNYAISDSKEPVEFIYSEIEHAAVSAITSTVPKSHYDDYYKHVETQTVTLNPHTLDDILMDVIGINLFILDIEGHEMNALNSFSWEVPLEVVMIENLDPSNKDIHSLLTSKGYFLDGIYKNNEIYYNPSFDEQVVARRLALGIPVSNE